MTALIYRSKHGYTKKIAETISKELNADLFSIKDAKNLDTSKYDSFVFGSSIYAGMFGGKEIGRASCRERVSNYV